MRNPSLLPSVDETWSAVLASLNPSTRVLMETGAKLTGLNQGCATIVTTRGLSGLVKDRMNLVMTAFTKVLGSPIEIELHISESRDFLPLPTTLPQPAYTDLDQLWQKVLNRLAAKSTRAMLEQQIKLVSLQGARARISSPPGLRRMVEDRVDQVNEAFSQVMGYPVKVTVETAPKNNS